MNRYKSNRNTLLVIDIVALTISFVLSLSIRYGILVKNIGIDIVVSTYEFFFAIFLIMYIVVSLLRRRIAVEKISIREILVSTFEQQVAFVAVYIVMFYLMKRTEAFSRVVVVLFLVGNLVFVSLFRVIYRAYCIKKGEQIPENYEETVGLKAANNEDEEAIRHVYIIGDSEIIGTTKKTRLKSRFQAVAVFAKCLFVQARQPLCSLLAQI